MNFRKFIAVILIFINCGLVDCQIPVGAWRDHLSWNTAEAVAVAEGKVYFSNGTGLGVSHPVTREAYSLTKLNGLSDAGISALAYAPDTKTVVVGYSNGNIDLINVYNNKTANISDVKRSTLYSVKRINNICIAGATAWMACSFGVIVIDLQRTSFTGSCIIGDGGLPAEVYAVTVCGERLYAATADGVKSIEQNNPLMADFSLWKKLNSAALANVTVKHLATVENSLYMSDDNGQMFRYEDGTVERITIPAAGKVFRLRGYASQLLIASSNGIITYDNATHSARTAVTAINGQAIEPYDVDFADGAFLIADHRQGLCRWVSESQVSLFSLKGPSSNQITALRYKAGRIYAVSGGMGDDGRPLHREGALHIFESNAWRSIRPEGLFDFTDVEVDEQQPATCYVSSWGGGIYVIENDAVTAHYDASNSALAASADGTLCGGLLLDRDKCLWATNGSSAAVFCNGQWTHAPWDARAALGRITEDLHGQIWTTRLNNGLCVFDKAATAAGQGDRMKGFAPYNSSMSATAYNTHDIACSPDGDIWVATGIGPFFYDEGNGEVERILDGGSTSGNHPLHPGKDDPGYLYGLLGSANTLTVAIDGAHRKWFGTDRGGVFLIDEDNANEVRHFTTANSPLFSDKVFDIAINERNGEVFFATELGLQSFRSDATASGDDFGHVYVFPNPVRPDYEGEITITGLIRDADVKITDITGNLVHQTHTLGGQAVWNGRDHRGRRVATGIYLVFCTNDDGSKTHVTKLLFVR